MCKRPTLLVTLMLFLLGSPAIAWAQGAGGTGGFGGEGGAPATTTCASYCGENLINCTDEVAQWATPDAQATCESFCAIWDQGELFDQLGDTLECRATHTNSAPADPDYFCTNAGPFGGGVCSDSPCASFCAAAATLCTGANELYTDVATCEEECSSFGNVGDLFTADSADTSNTFRCRGYHLTAAADDPDTHCQHAGGPGSLLGDSTICGSGSQGTGGGGGGSATDGVGVGPGATGSGAGPGGGGNDDNCSCRVAGEPEGEPAQGPASWWLLGMVGLIARRRS